ncbi:MAG: HlyD family secretion protein [Desmonostoc vinosum HA7617-LM4]|jgi:HlyD family secretion protein|nr:HlyD family secretion protein [Desmonostoc vinosum HA7617-LM4]
MDTPQPDQLRVLNSNEFLPRISPWAIIGGVFIVSVFGIGVALTTVLKYNVTIKVPATIRPAGELRLVQAAIEGTVKQIQAEENQVVKEGDAIARIDDSRLQTQKSQLQSTIQQNQLQLQQIDAQIKNLETQIAAETSLINRTIVAAQAELGGTQRNYTDQQVLVQADITQAQTALNVAIAQRDRLKQEKLITATVQEAEAALKLAKTQKERLQPIIQSGAIPRTLLEEKEQAVTAAEARLEQAKAGAKNLLEEKEQAVQVAQVNLDKARAAINPSDAAVTVASERIKQEKAKGEASLAALNKELQTLLQQRLELQKQSDRNRQELQQVITDLSQSIIRAPISGTVLQLNLRNQNQVVRVGESIASITPMNGPLLIKAQVAAVDIDKVKPEQKVQMQVSACPYPDFGTLKGTVKTVAADALPTVNNGTTAPATAAYEVTIQPQSLFVGDSKRQCPLKPGMEGKADIISREETVLKFILRKTRLVANL